MQIDPVALEFDVIQLDLAVLVAAGLHGQHLGVSREPLQRGKHVSYGSSTERSEPRLVECPVPERPATAGQI